MKDLIKEIREITGLSQSEMAKKLSVTFATINRWENGHSVPTRMAQEKMFELCESYSVPLYDMILSKIKRAEKEIMLPKDRILLYHGSKSGITGNIAPISRGQCDFGQGFYMGTVPEQALTLICGFEKSKFYILSVDISSVSCVEVPADIEWALLVAYHRGRMEKIRGTKFYNRYSTFFDDKDLVVGSIANDRMFFVIDNFFQEQITDEALVNSLSALQLGKQYVAVTQKGCAAVRIEKEIPLSYMEKIALQKVGEENRKKGINLANEICKAHRRDGKFFDEILKEAIKGEEDE